jgi:Angiotensin-converting enzyme
LEERKSVWEASEESGPAVKPNLIVLRDLRNGVAREMKYPDYFSLEVASYGMTTDRDAKNAGRLDGNASSALSATAYGEDISTRAMAEYFKPLQSWLEEQNKGRQIGWE